MKTKNKYIIVFLLFCSLSMYGQQYRLNLRGYITGATTPELIENGTISVYIDGSFFSQYTESYNYLSINDNFTINPFTNFSMNEISSTAPGDVSPTCSSSDTDNNNTISNLLLSSANVSGCATSLTASLKPIITDVQQSNGSGSELCIGDLLSLGAFPAGFPNIAYNWQYSTNGTQWFNFPPTFNLVSQVNATMEDLLGTNHTDFIGSNVFIRLGRGFSSNGNYSPTFTVNYSSCAPLVSSINYNPPNCTGDSVSVVVNLHRALETGETFSQIGIINASDSTQILAQVFDISTDAPNGTTFTFNNVSELEEGVSYKIRYQMKQDGVTVLGFIESVQTFTFNDATPVTFDASWTPAVNCFGDNTGSISITAAGGDGNYEYSINDGTNWFPFSNANTHSVTNLIAGNYQVKVRDGNNCVAQDN